MEMSNTADAAWALAEVMMYFLIALWFVWFLMAVATWLGWVPKEGDEE